MKSNKGVTLIILTVMIIVIIIIASITIYSGTNVIKESKEKKLQTELETVQHAVLENYSKYLVTKDLPSEGGTAEYIIGTKITYAEAKNVANKMGVDLKVNNYDSASLTDNTQFYYRLGEEQLKQIGVENLVEDGIEIDKYIVNYATGEVMNESKADEKVLYVYAVDLR